MKAAVYHNLPMGGALRALQEQVRRLSRKHTIHCYSLSSSAEDGRALNAGGIECTVFEYWLKDPAKARVHDWMSSLRQIALVQMQVAEQINQGGYDVCLTNTCPYFEIPSIHKYLDIPVVYYAHSMANPYVSMTRSKKRKRNLNPLGWLLHWLIRCEQQQAMMCADIVLTNSYFLRSELFKRYRTKAAVNRLGVDTDLFCPQTDRTRGNYVLGVGTLAPFKAHDFSISSLALVPEERRPEFWIAYPDESPGEKGYLCSLAEYCGVQLRFFKKVNAEDLRGLYNNALATLFPSSYEGLGLVPLESMSCGTPVVGVADGGITETIVDGVTGYLTQRNHKEFARRIMDFVDNPGLTSEMGAIGRKYVINNWNWQKSVEQLEAVLTDATNKVWNCERFSPPDRYAVGRI